MAEILNGRDSDCLSGPPRPPRAGEVAQLAAPVDEAAERAPGRPVLELELDLGQPIAGADGIDGHPDLHPVSGGEREHRAQDLGSHRPLARER